MRRPGNYLVLAAIAGMCAGCERATTPEATATNASAQAVREEIAEANRATQNYVAENRDEFVASMKQKLEAADRKIDELSRRADNLQGEARKEADQQLAALREKRDTARRTLDEAQTAGKEAWQKIKGGFQSAYRDLEKAFQDASDEVH